MNKLYSLFLSLLLSVGVISGCGNADKPVKENHATEENAKQKEESAFPVTIKDASDKEVVIEEKPEKIVSLIPSNTEIAYELGLGENIVGVSDNDNYPEEVTDIEKVGGMEMNVEKIISLDPDLVLAHASNALNTEEGLQQIRDAGIDVLVVNNAQNFDQVYDSIEMIGQASGAKEKADGLVSNMKEQLDEVKTKAAGITEKKKVFVEVSFEPDIYTTGKNTFMDQMLTIINAENAAGDLEGWVKMDQEAIIKQNPDVIVTTYGKYYDKPVVDQVLAREGWQGVNAIKNKQVFDVNDDLVSRPGPRLVEGVEEFAKAVYPETFK